jgi:hypothetical protein
VAWAKTNAELWEQAATVRGQVSQGSVVRLRLVRGHIGAGANRRCCNTVEAVEPVAEARQGMQGVLSGR